jgi:hypothetical protein
MTAAVEPASRSRAGKYDGKPFLGEVMIVGQHLRDPHRPESEHRAAIGQAVRLVPTRFVQGKGCLEVGARLREYIDRWIVSQIANLGDGQGTPVWSSVAPVIQRFGEDLIARNNAWLSMRGYRPLPRHGRRRAD